MDFGFTDEQQALRDLVARILGDHATHERLKALERGGGWWDRECWRALARANVLGLAIPEAHGGSGLGLVELGLVLEEVGRHVAPVPVWATLVLGALPLAAFGTAPQQTRWLPAVAGGETILTAALVELPHEDPWRPATVARRDGGGWRLDGVKTTVPAGMLADAALVPARAGDDLGVFLVELAGRGVARAAQVATHGEPQARLALDGAPGEPVGDPAGGRAVLDWLVPRATATLCATATGVAERAVRITAAYTRERRQFDRPIGSFQAVQQRAADAWIDVEAMRLTAWQALWRLAEGHAADAEVSVAKLWAAEGGHRATYAAQHLHGGMGVDLDYPVHRHYLWATAIALALGAGARHAARLGARLAVGGLAR